MPARFIFPQLQEIAQSVIEHKQSIAAGLGTYFYLKIGSIFSLSVPAESSAAVEFVAAMIEYLLQLFSALSVAVASAYVSHQYKKYLVKKDGTKRN